MKKRYVLLMAAILLVVALGTVLTACGQQDAASTTQSADVSTTNTAPTATDTTAPAGTETTAPAGPQSDADAAIAAITKSAAIETPPTLKPGVLQAGSDTSFPPMEFSDGKGGYIGFDVDLCTALAKKMGLQLEVVSTAWDGIIPALLGDRFDMIMSAMTITEERLKQINFTDPYLPGILAISAPISNPITDATGLVGKIVGVQVDTTGQFEVEKIQGIKELKKYGTILEAFQDLAAGRVDCVVNDEPVNAYIIETNPDYKAKFANTGKIVTVNDYGYAVKKENTALLQALNAALKELRADGIYQKICDKWGLTGN
ncbi:MAG: transporter substrate-binding domain-containing protein [Thermoleophilia bacterium]|nr:transporter substrate-binding domain-containing protein [Thermoleophilia bacterium]